MNQHFPTQVKIVEVGPRDGLQNESNIIPTEIKIEFIKRLAKTGLRNIEAGSFVSAKRIPQLADSEIVLANIINSHSKSIENSFKRTSNNKQEIKQANDSNITYSVLVPNLQGMEKALALNLKHIAVFTAASETFSQKNTHCSIEESLKRIQEIMRLAKEQTQTQIEAQAQAQAQARAKSQAIHVRGYISCVLGCPYEGEIAVAKVVALAKQLHNLGCEEISLGDTIGVGTPNKAKALIKAVLDEVPLANIALHFHDTYGQALANIYAGLELGVNVIDSSITGLGGCPYAAGASGNVATEDVLYMLDGLGIKTGVDLNSLLEVSRFVVEFTKRPPRSKVAQAFLKF